MPLFIILLGLGFLLGAIVGSFLNVCIYRIPAGESIVRPRSRCGSCGSSIKWYQNVPIFSFLALRGRCAACGARISWRYPLVEALTGGLFALLVFRFGPQPFVAVLMLLVATLVTITFIDFDHQIIPDVSVCPGSPSAFWVPFDSRGYPGVIPSWAFCSVGQPLPGGGGISLFTGNEGMGGGDIKLLAMIGAFLGWKAIVRSSFFPRFWHLGRSPGHVGEKGRWQAGHSFRAVSFGRCHCLSSLGAVDSPLVSGTVLGESPPEVAISPKSCSLANSFLPHLVPSSSVLIFKCL